MQAKDWAMVQRIYGLGSFDRDGFQRSLDERISSEILLSAARSSFDLLRLASHCKNRAFSEEKEWRLALPHSKGGMLLVSRSLGVGRTALSLTSSPISFNQPEKLPITRVMLGPLCDLRKEVERSWQLTDTVCRCWNQTSRSGPRHRSLSAPSLLAPAIIKRCSS